MDEALQVFQSASGLSPDWIVMVTSAVFIVLAVVIYGLCLLVELRHLADKEFSDVVMTVFRIIYMLGLIVACFAI